MSGSLCRLRREIKYYVNLFCLTCAGCVCINVLIYLLYNSCSMNLQYIYSHHTVVERLKIWTTYFVSFYGQSARTSGTMLVHLSFVMIFEGASDKLLIEKNTQSNLQLRKKKIHLPIWIILKAEMRATKADTKAGLFKTFN